MWKVSPTKQNHHVYVEKKIRVSYCKCFMPLIQTSTVHVYGSDWLHQTKIP